MRTAPVSLFFAQSRWSYFLQLASILALLGVFLSLMSVNDAVNGGFAAKAFLVGRMALLILICTWFLRRGGESWADLGLRRPPRWWLVPLLVTGGFVAMLVLSSFLMNTVLPAMGLSLPQLKNDEFAGDLAEFLFFLIPIAWGTAAFGEEMLFRGFVLDRIRKIIGSSGRGALLAAVVLQGVLFGSVHFYQGLGGILVTGSLGILFGLIWLVGGRNLWACIILHGLINTVSDIEAYDAPPAPRSQIEQQHSRQ